MSNSVQGFGNVLHIDPDVVEELVSDACIDAADAEMPADIVSSEVERLAASVARHRGQLVAKRILDLFGGAVLVALFAPLLLLLAVAVCATSRGPALYRQERIGANGKRFHMIKFRTMYVDLPPEIVAEIRRHEQGGNLFKSENDPRVTPAGCWLRRYSMDELPQLFNVLGGSMSLVGPRPLMLHMAIPYPNFVAARSMMRPGMTGLWQVLDRERATNAAFMIRHDLKYVEQFSLALDMKILLLTLPAMLSGTGAH